MSYVQDSDEDYTGAYERRPKLVLIDQEADSRIFFIHNDDINYVNGYKRITSRIIQPG